MAKKDITNKQAEEKEIQDKKTSSNKDEQTSKDKKEKKDKKNASKSKKSKTTEKIKELETKLEELNDKYLRLSAEYDNYRKRTLKERMELIKSAAEDTLINFLPITDNLDRAKKSVDNAKDIEAVKTGIDLIYKNIYDFLTERGVKEIEAVGEPFNTDLHEALTKIPAPEENMKGKVIDVIEKGYMLKDKVLRYAKVVVGE